jgi:hypothetical protein
MGDSRRIPGRGIRAAADPMSAIGVAIMTVPEAADAKGRARLGERRAVAPITRFVSAKPTPD